MMTLGKKIALTRKLKGITQRQLAEKLHIDPAMVTRWEKDQVHPKSSTLQRLADALELSADELASTKEIDLSKRCSPASAIKSW
jgi:transcriptional regulator with XRE-family HTH domain